MSCSSLFHTDRHRVVGKAKYYFYKRFFPPVWSINVIFAPFACDRVYGWWERGCDEDNCLLPSGRFQSSNLALALQLWKQIDVFEMPSRLLYNWMTQWQCCCMFPFSQTWNLCWQQDISLEGAKMCNAFQIFCSQLLLLKAERDGWILQHVISLWISVHASANGWECKSMRLILLSDTFRSADLAPSVKELYVFLLQVWRADEPLHTL